LYFSCHNTPIYLYEFPGTFIKIHTFLIGHMVLELCPRNYMFPFAPTFLATLINNPFVHQLQLNAPLTAISTSVPISNLKSWLTPVVYGHCKFPQLISLWVCCIRTDFSYFWLLFPFIIAGFMAGGCSTFCPCWYHLNHQLYI